MTLPNGQKVVAFDFDGVLHEYHGWNDGKLNGPIPGMLLLVDSLRAEGAYCVIHTTRDKTTVEGWLREHGFPDMDVYNTKWQRIDVFVDDRAFAFHPCFLETPETIAALKETLLNFQPHWRRGSTEEARET